MQQDNPASHAVPVDSAEPRVTAPGGIVPVPPYQALALQVTTHSVGHLSDPAAREGIARNIERVAEAVAASKTFIAEQGGDLRLVVLPEYSLTGSPGGGAFSRWRAKAAIARDGPEYESLGRIATRLAIYLCGNAYEEDPNFPYLYFQTTFVIAPSGQIALRYRRLVSLYSPSPYDLLERYLDIYGRRSLFPVIDTPIGRIAAVASEEILYPEIARCHAMLGAEVLVHPTSEMGSPRPTAKDIAKQARAAENLAYVISANAARVYGTGLPAHSTTGMAKIVDYEGRIIAAAMPGGDSLAANAAIDIEALRARRRRPGLTNTLVRQPLQAYADSYQNSVFHAAGQLASNLAEPMTDILRGTQAAEIRRLERQGVI